MTAVLTAPLAPAREAAGGAGRVRAPRRDAGIDALRAGAALTVLAIHAGLFPVDRPGPGHSGTGRVLYLLWRNLDVGVDIFFALSGYLIAGPFLRRLVSGEPLPDIRSYAVRRALRVLPAYWVALAVITGAPFVPWPWWMWTLHVLLLQNPFPGQLDHGLPVAWSLHVEVMFYILVPVVCCLVRRRTGPRPVRPATVVRFLVAVGVVSLAFAVVVGQLDPGSAGRPLRLSVPATLVLFVPGMLLAVVRSPSVRWPRAQAGLATLASGRVLAVALLLLLALALAMDATPSPGLADGRRIVRATAGLLLLAHLTTPGRRHGRVVNALAPLGVISFGIYLWHFLLQRDLQLYGVFEGVHGHFAFVADVAVLFAVTVPCALASWVLVERPAIRLATFLSKPQPRLARAARIARNAR